MENWKQQTIEADLEIIVLRNRIEELSKYEALYAEARESLCSCNHTDTPEKGWEYNYTCEWCEQHPEGAEAPDVIKRMWAMEERNSSLVEGIRKLADELHERASREYCSYVEQMRREECLGWEAKIEAGQFGDKELAGHTYAGTLLGRHRALAKVAEEVLALVPPDQKEKK